MTPCNFLENRLSIVLYIVILQKIKFNSVKVKIHSFTPSIYIA